MNKHPFEILALANGAKLIFTPCPGTKAANLEESIQQLKQQDVSMLLTLMFDKEMVENEAIKLPQLCKMYQIQWLQLPIIDDEAPGKAFQSQWEKHKLIILNQLKNKGVVAVHCKGGTGRTGTVIALLLLALGWPVDKIIREVQSVRPQALRIKKQLDYLNSQLMSSEKQFPL
ncbi:tyrosine-protein phosphatase [Candidatus Colwellia aromaticivorans]|uniref:phosphatase domain-containing protein n=1 Tax=Candidatus Colwellia aromaticivorans TaxID=2267621 RepID=UPI000DF38FC8|nr:tyrosine-protein phosphatase [Candidatus Colwellia aromaticivorans]